MAVKMPEPTAYASSDPVRKNQLWSRSQYDSALPKNRECCDIPLITTTQAQAYADARANEKVDELITWAVGKWFEQVANRPMTNIHRRSLDDTWRLILKHLGADDVALLGLDHDSLLEPKQ